MLTWSLGGRYCTPILQMKKTQLRKVKHFAQSFQSYNFCWSWFLNLHYHPSSFPGQLPRYCSKQWHLYLKWTYAVTIDLAWDISFHQGCLWYSYVHPTAESPRVLIKHRFLAPFIGFWFSRSGMGRAICSCWYRCCKCRSGASTWITLP